MMAIAIFNFSAHTINSWSFVKITAFSVAKPIMKLSGIIPAQNVLALSLVLLLTTACNVGSYDDAVQSFNDGRVTPPPVTPPPPTGFNPVFPIFRRTYLRLHVRLRHAIQAPGQRQD
jgi:hypothetical protein